ncbi:uncharacterized protein METZ01_LOCUS53217 [marine metagenome]|uniref:Uncharacterized protein n=1 Tax=marine metagenome TaxID=408172 RepID=A0A381SGQ1_9ZZZZ
MTSLIFQGLLPEPLLVGPQTAVEARGRSHP